MIVSTCIAYDTKCCTYLLWHLLLAACMQVATKQAVIYNLRDGYSFTEHSLPLIPVDMMRQLQLPGSEIGAAPSPGEHHAHFPTAQQRKLLTTNCLSQLNNSPYAQVLFLIKGTEMSPCPQLTLTVMPQAGDKKVRCKHNASRSKQWFAITRSCARLPNAVSSWQVQQSQQL